MTVRGLYRVSVETLVADVPCTFTLAYKNLTGAPGNHAIELAGLVFTQISGALLAVLSSSVWLMRIIARPLNPEDGNPYEANYDDSNVGTGGAEPLAPSLAMLLKLRTISDNSRNNGHLYISGVPENVWVDGVWEPATFVPLVDTLNTALAGVLFAAGNPFFQPVVLSRFEDGVELADPVANDINLISLAPRISQQRRRQSGRQGIGT